MRNPRIVRQTWNLGNEQRDPRIEQIPGLRVTFILARAKIPFEVS